MKILKNNITGLFVVALLLMPALKTEAQNVEFGLRFMPTFSAFDMKTSEGGTVSGSLTFGMGYGALVGLSISDHIGIQAEAIYLKMSQKYKEMDVERNVELNYINIPLLLAFNTGKNKPVNLNFVLGPQIGISVGTSIHVSVADGTNGSQAKLSTKSSDLGFAYGAGLDFGINTAQNLRLGLGFRGVQGLLDISDNSESVTTDEFYVLNRTKTKTYAGYIGFSILF